VKTPLINTKLYCRVFREREIDEVCDIFVLHKKIIIDYFSLNRFQLVKMRGFTVSTYAYNFTFMFFFWQFLAIINRDDQTKQIEPQEKKKCDDALHYIHFTVVKGAK